MSQSQQQPFSWQFILTFVLFLLANLFPLMAVSSLKLADGPWRDFIMAAWLPVLIVAGLGFLISFFVLLKGFFSPVQKKFVFAFLAGVNLFAITVAYEATRDHIFNSTFKEAKVESIMGCSDNPKYSCAVVNTSEYSKLMGIPVSDLGMLLYFVLMVFHLLGIFLRWEVWRSISLFPVLAYITSVIMSLYLFYIIIFVLKENCPLCYTMHSTHFIGFFAYLFLFSGDFSNKKGFIDFTGIFNKFLELTHQRVAGISLGVGAIATLGFSGYVWNINVSMSNAAQEELKQIIEGAMEQDGLKTYKIGTDTDDGSRKYFTSDELKNQYEKTKTYSISTDNSPTKPYKYQGKPAAVTMVVYEDFTCSKCKVVATEWVPILLEKFPEEFKYVFKSYPVDKACNPNLSDGGVSNENACLAARYAFGAYQLDSYYFHELEQSLYENQSNLSPSDIELYLSDIGVMDDSFETVKKYAESEESLKRVQLDIAEKVKFEGEKANATPGIYINGRKVAVYEDINDLTTLIEAIMEIEKH